jgi:hypothetical protein
MSREWSHFSMGYLLSIWAWAIFAYSRVVGPPPDVEPTRRYFARIGIHVD